MGYDCTLHVVDERMIREQFVPRLLGRSDERSRFDERHDAADLWGQVRESLTGESPRTAANYVCQLAIAYCAAQLPYHYERGFCLSLWPDLEEQAASAVPKKFRGDPAALFSEVVAAHPGLARQFPTGIESNYCPGLFIPAANVPQLLAWVEKRVKRMPKPDRRLFRGLLLVLQYAAEHGLAYWEGTEIPVPMKTIMPPGEKRRADLEEVRLPDYAPAFKHRRGDVLVFTDVGSGEDAWTLFADLRCWPPAFHTLPEYAVEVDSSRGGKWVMAAQSGFTPDELGGGFVFEARLRDDPPWSPSSRSTVLRVEGPHPELGLRWVGLVGERVVAARPVFPRHLPKAIPLVQHDDALREISGFVRPDRGYPAVARLADGGDVFFWGGTGFELRGGEFVRTFGLTAKQEHDWSYVPYGSDGLFCVLNRQLHEVRRGQPPRLHLPKLTNVMYVSPGPRDSVLLDEGDNKAGDLGKLYFPGEDAYVRIEPELFEDEDPEAISSLHWCQTSGRLIAATAQRLWAVPATSVLALPRYRAGTGRKIKG